MRFSVGPWLFLLAGTPFKAQALLAEDAGMMDFHIATAGHGSTNFVHAQGGTMLTTDVLGTQQSGSSSCYVANRRIDTGDLIWRRNVCSVPSDSQQHALAIRNSSGSSSSISSSSSSGEEEDTDLFYTLDDGGIVRAWTRTEGMLVWDAQVTAPIGPPRIFVVAGGPDAEGEDTVAVGSDGDLTFLQASTGRDLDTISALTALDSKLKSGETLQWLTVQPFAKKSHKMHGVVAYVQADGTTSGNRMVRVEMEFGNDRFTSTKSLGHVKSTVVAASFYPQLGADGGEVWQGLAMTSSGTIAYFSLDDSKESKELSAASIQSDWTSVVAVRPASYSSFTTVQGIDKEGSETMGLFSFDANFGWKLVSGKDSASVAAIVYCAQADLVVAMGTNSLQAYRYGNGNSMTPVSVTGNTFVPNGGDSVADISVIECTKDKVTTLLSTVGGTTTQISFVVQQGTVVATVGWTAEEGLASVTSAVILDASHMGSDDLVEEQDVVANKLSFSSRMASQLQGLISLVTTPTGAEFSRRDHIFGFVKIAALLSQSSHRIWGVATSGDDRGLVQWSLDLPKTALFHAMVHGTTNSNKATHGINGGTHSREILVVSASPDSVEWKCIDGTNGAIHAQDAIHISSPVLQVVPMYGSAGACRQASLLLHEDRTLSVVPGDADTAALVQEQLQHTPNGLFTHYVDTAASKLESFQVAAATNADGSFTPRQVGRASFSGERIVKVTYPIRDEVVQTMSAILGDNSLLLKYINPHLAVVVTMAEDDIAAFKTRSSLVASLEKTQGTHSARKPAGAGDTGAASVVNPKSDDGVPNMFVNLVDTVSGRVLHRASHSNVDATQDVVALVSENWVIYSFTNIKTRRTEIGVLTLHEGMIDSKGISLFSAAEQTTSFSSFDARESKPVVLSKTYTYPKHITALGVTATRGGISSRNILIASSDGKITQIGRTMLETRRPLGQVKDVEKKEGLFPYSELIMEVPFMAITYNQTVESVRSVVATPTSLESQSLVLAFGGPDIFVTRTSPSKGFDLLPDSFSRVLVSIVTVGLVVVLFVVRRMGDKKALAQGWL